MNEDKEFIKRIAGGDKTAFNELVTVYADRIINTCYRFFPVREDAEDISQEVFIEVLRSIKSFRGDAKLSTWIYRIAVTKCLDEIKKRNRKKRFSSLGNFLHLDEIAHSTGGGAMPDRPLKERESMDEIIKALNSLPDNQRAAYTLSKVEGYTNREIAEIMNTSVSAVETLISRAGRKVRQELEEILKNNI